MNETPARTILPYVIAVVSVGLALGVRDLLDPTLGDRQPLVVFYLAVAVAAWFGGLWPGLLATFGGYLLADWFFIPPRHAFSFLRDDDVLFGAGIYLLVGTTMSGLTELTRRAARKLARSEARLKGLIGSATDAIIAIDADQKIMIFNAAAEAMFGYAAEEMIGCPLDALIPEPYRQVHRRHVNTFGGTGGGSRQMGGERVLVGLRRDGSEFPMEAQISQAEIDDERFYTVVIRDITERKRAEEVQARYVRMVDSGFDAIMVRDTEDRITNWNRGATELYGWTRDEALGQVTHALFQTKFPKPLDAILTDVLRNDRWEGELVQTRKDGAVITVFSRWTLERDAQGRRMSILETNTDLTARKRSEARLAANLRALQRVHDVSTRFVRAGDLHACLAAILDAAIETTGADLGNIQLVNSGSGLLEIVAQRGFEREFLDFFGAVHDHVAACGTAKTTGRRVIVEDVHTDPIFREPQVQAVMRSAGVRAVQATPLLNRNGELMGMLSTHFRTRHQPKEEDLRLVDIFAQQAADIIEQARAEQARQELLGMTERARAAAELATTAERDAREVAEAANRTKDAFLATVSHELRAPLSPILAWSRMLRQGVLDADKASRALETIERSAKSQAQLIEDLLDVSRIVAGRMRLEVRPVDLVAVTEAAVDVVRPAAEAKAVRLQTVLDSEVGMISGDAERLQQVVWNLLSNAVKFTPKGGSVQVVLERVNSHAEIAVTDSGSGISAAFLPRVFERFEQFERGSSRAHSGLGLGLAIVRHIVELHGGTVHAESPGEGKGAVFTVKLPLIQIKRTAGEVTRRHPTVGGAPDVVPYPTLRGVRALVVDDDPDSNETVRVLLGSCGADVRVAGSAAQAREMLARWKPDVLVSDVGMPGEDGYGLITSVRAQDTELPAVALTAYATVEDRVRLLAAGYQAHVTKPLDPAELLAVVASVTRGVDKL